jgi:hypothetical protein
MTCLNKEELENMLEDVVNELDLSAGMVEQHGPLGTAPATLVRLVLAQKDLEIRMLKAGMVCIEPNKKLISLEALQQAVIEMARETRDIYHHPLRKICYFMVPEDIFMKVSNLAKEPIQEEINK